MPTPLTSAIARTYPAKSQQVSTVRADLRAWLGACAELDDVILCASELATNAIIHSRSGELGGSITVTADLCAANCLRIEVHDSGGPWTQPTVAPDRPHGLDIVDMLASKWGVNDVEVGRIVWAELDWPGA